MTHQTVLIVEDEPAVRGVARIALEKAGYDVVLADDGPAALAAFASDPGRVAAVVLDVNLPGLSGWQVLAELRRLRPDVPVVLTTGDQCIEFDTAEPGELPTAVLPKPYRPSDLSTVVARVLAGR